MAGQEQSPGATTRFGDQSDMGEKARQATQGVADNAKAAAQSAGEQIQQRAESGKEQAADALESASESIRKAAEQLHDQPRWMADAVENGADQLAGLAHTLRENDLRSLLNQAEQLGRRQPVLFGAGAFALGFAAMRAARAGLASASRSGSVRDLTSRDRGYESGPTNRPGNGNGAQWPQSSQEARVEH